MLAVAILRSPVALRGLLSAGLGHLDFAFRICFGFRDSDFEFAGEARDRSFVHFVAIAVRRFGTAERPRTTRLPPTLFELRRDKSPRLPPSLYELRRDTSGWQAARARTICYSARIIGLLALLKSGHESSEELYRESVVVTLTPEESFRGVIHGNSDGVTSGFGLVS